MSLNDRPDEFGNGARKREELAGPGGSEPQDAEFAQALRDFRMSVHGWSEATLSRPRNIAVSRASTWRVASGWALGCALLVGGVSGGMFEHHRRAELARITAAQQAQQERQLAAQKAQEEEDLLARVDSDVSREVPNAMEPLAQLMAQDESK
jgi:hypothetical protein